MTSMNNVLNFYREEWKFFRERHLRTFLFLSALFIVAIIASLFYFHIHPEAAQKEIKTIDAVLGKMRFYSQFQVMASILIRNLIICFFILIMGLIPFFLLPIFPMLKNCYALAALIHLAGNYSFLTLTATILPHGIIEFPALIYTTCLGVHLSLRRTRNRNVMLTIDSVQMEPPGALQFSRALKIYALIVTPVLVLAAIIETFLTPVLFFAING